jgi:methyl-accepting chemotaxis protein
LDHEAGARPAAGLARLEQRRAQEILDERRRGLIRVLAWSMLGLLLVGLGAMLLPLVLPPQRPLRNPFILLIFAAGFAYSGITLYLLEKKRTRRAAYLLVYGFTAIVGVSVLATAQPGSEEIISLRLSGLFYLIVLWAGLLIDARHAFVAATIASAVVSIAIGLAFGHTARGDLTGYVTQLFEVGSISFTVYYGIAFATWFFSGAVRGLVNQLTARSVSLAESGAVIRQGATLREETGAALQRLAGQVATAQQQQLGALSEQTAAVQMISVTVDQLAETANEIAHLAEQAGSFATDAWHEIDRGQQIIAHALRALGQLDGSMQTITARMQALEAQVDSTTGVTERMGAIAQELHLLALNAKIEAAGAGDAGARFHVVVDEIDRLAAAAQADAARTRHLLGEVRTASREALAATNQGHALAREGATVAEEAATANTAIADLVAQATAPLQAIGSSTDQQHQGAQQLAAIMHQAAAALDQTRRMSQDTARIAADLLDLAHQLRIVADSDLPPVESRPGPGVRAYALHQRSTP